MMNVFLLVLIGIVIVQLTMLTGQGRALIRQGRELRYLVDKGVSEITEIRSMTYRLRPPWSDQTLASIRAKLKGT